MPVHREVCEHLDAALATDDARMDLPAAVDDTDLPDESDSDIYAIRDHASTIGEKGNGAVLCPI